jgi:gluconokinase
MVKGSGLHAALLVMGVCGTGKSLIGQTVASELGAAFVEGDDFHSADNKRHMAAGLPLTDAMRWPWLDAVAQAAASARQQGPVVVACSALKEVYRDRLRRRLPSLSIAYLSGDPALIAARMSARNDHFMPVSLLESQLRDCEAPQGPDVIAVAIEQPLALSVRRIRDFALTRGGREQASR